MRYLNFTPHTCSGSSSATFDPVTCHPPALRIHRHTVATQIALERYRSVSSLRRLRFHAAVPIVAIIASLLVAAGGAPSRADAQPTGPRESPPGEWVHLGPSRNFRTEHFAVSPGWPTDRFLVAYGSGVAMQSVDGGITWNRGNEPPVSVTSLIPTPLTAIGRLIFAIGTPIGATSGWMIVRSADGGVSWTTVLTALGRDNLPYLAPRFTLSPGFGQDGHAFAIHLGKLYRSQDFGNSWGVVQAPAVQRIQQVAFSPSFTTDRTLFAAVVDGTFPPAWGTQDDAVTSTHHDTSLGIVISTDGGGTWRASSAGLEIDGTPYRYVQQIGLSPTFERDGTVFAFAWGPWGGASVPSALFRSSDRGQSWSPVWHSKPSRDGLRWYANLTLSSGFDADSVGMMALTGLSSWNAGPHSGIPCLTFTTRNAGQTWTENPRVNDSPPRCLSLIMAPGTTNGRVAFSRACGDGGACGAYRSFDDGTSWDWITPPVYPRSRSGNGAAWSYVVARDGTLFIQTQDGIWALGPSARMPAPPPLPDGSTVTIERPGEPR
jgi:hypothetical protein